MLRTYQRLAVAFVLALVALALCAPLASAVGSDWDADGIRNGLDNCAKQSNPDQTDLDGDGQGDVCDPDRDGDGQLDAVDPCPDDALNGCVAPPPPLPDTTPPETTIDAKPNDPSNNASPSFGFTSTEANSTFECSVDGGAYASCTSPKSLSSKLSDGSHTFAVKATDAAGNTDATPDSYTWTVDTVAPNTTIDAKPNDPSNNASPSFTFTGTDNVTSAANLTFECKLDTGNYGSCTSPNSLSSLSGGSHTFYVRAIDEAGNVDATPASYTWTVDTTPPETTITEGGTTTQADASFSFSSNEAGSTFSCQLDASGFAPCTSPMTYNSLSNASHTFEVKAKDAAGNTDATPAKRTWTVNTT